MVQTFFSFAVCCSAQRRCGSTTAGKLAADARTGTTGWRYRLLNNTNVAR
jgi:hypothetical protein